MKNNIFTLSLFTFIIFLLLTEHSYAQRKKKELPSGMFNSMEDALKEPEEVLILDLSNQKLTEVPEEILLFTNLRQLILTKNRLVELPDYLGRLSQLTYLNVSANNLNALPHSIGRLHQLSSLDFSRNKISTLPESFFQMKSIEIINCYSNPLYFEPEKLTKIASQIKYINIQNTKIENEHCEQLVKILEAAKIKCSKKCNCQK
jgi:Leucine-rich repeat (LRR) protein